MPRQSGTRADERKPRWFLTLEVRAESDIARGGRIAINGIRFV